MDDHRQSALIGEGEDVADLRRAEPEALRARMQLDAARPEGHRPLGLAPPAVERVDATKRDEPAVESGGGSKHPVVRGPVGPGLGEREHHGARVDHGERGDELLGIEAGAVRVRASEMGVRVEQPQVPQPLPQ